MLYLLSIVISVSTRLNFVKVGQECYPRKSVSWFDTQHTISNASGFACGNFFTVHKKGDKDPASRLFEEFDSSLDNLLWTNDD